MNKIKNIFVLLSMFSGMLQGSLGLFSKSRYDQRANFLKAGSLAQRVNSEITGVLNAESEKVILFKKGIRPNINHKQVREFDQINSMILNFDPLVNVEGEIKQVQIELDCQKIHQDKGEDKGSWNNLDEGLAEISLKDGRIKVINETLCQKLGFYHEDLYTYTFFFMTSYNWKINRCKSLYTFKSVDDVKHVFHNVERWSNIIGWLDINFVIDESIEDKSLVKSALLGRLTGEMYENAGGIVNQDKFNKDIAKLIVYEKLNSIVQSFTYDSVEKIDIVLRNILSCSKDLYQCRLVRGSNPNASDKVEEVENEVLNKARDNIQQEMSKASPVSSPLEKIQNKHKPEKTSASFLTWKKGCCFVLICLLMMQYKKHYATL